MPQGSLGHLHGEQAAASHDPGDSWLLLTVQLEGRQEWAVYCHEEARTLDREQVKPVRWEGRTVMVDTSAAFPLCGERIKHNGLCATINSNYYIHYWCSYIIQNCVCLFTCNGRDILPRSQWDLRAVFGTLRSDPWSAQASHSSWDTVWEALIWFLAFDVLDVWLLPYAHDLAARAFACPGVLVLPFLLLQCAPARDVPIQHAASLVQYARSRQFLPL